MAGQNQAFFKGSVNEDELIWRCFTTHPLDFLSRNSMVFCHLSRTCCVSSNLISSIRYAKVAVERKEMIFSQKGVPFFGYTSSFRRCYGFTSSCDFLGPPKFLRQSSCCFSEWRRWSGSTSLPSLLVWAVLEIHHGWIDLGNVPKKYSKHPAVHMAIWVFPKRVVPQNVSLYNGKPY